MSPDLEVWWDGTHQNADRDLLCCAKVQTKRQAPPLSSAAIQIDRGNLAAETVERCLFTAPRTKREIQQLTGCSMSAIANALYQLMHQHVVCVVGSRRTACYRRPLRVYGLTPEETWQA